MGKQHLENGCKPCLPTQYSSRVKRQNMYRLSWTFKSGSDSNYRYFHG